MPPTLNSIFMKPITRTSRPGAFSCTAILFAILATFTLQPYSVAEARQVALPGPQCHPSVVRSMPERIRKICDALKVIWDFNDSMENYLDEKGKENTPHFLFMILEIYYYIYVNFLISCSIVFHLNRLFIGISSKIIVRIIVFLIQLSLPKVNVRF